VTFVFGPFELKNGTPVAAALGNIHTDFGFSALLCFRVMDRRTDRQTNGQDSWYGLCGRLHDKEETKHD